MNDRLDDLGRAVRSALGDIVAKAPTADLPRRRRLDTPCSKARRSTLTVAALVTVAAGLVGMVALVVIVNRGPDGMSDAERDESPTRPRLRSRS